jgi:enolase
MSDIINILARQIFDSRGNPTVEVDVELSSGAVGRASAPSGASTGTHEAIERRDGEDTRYKGKGVLSVVKSINTEIFDTLKGFDAHDQLHIDNTLCALDGTENKSRLGANATLAVSLAVAKAAADDVGYPLYRYLKGAFSYIMPVPLINVLNGGAHADNPLDIQEFMIVPVGAETFAEAMMMGNAVFFTLKQILRDKQLNTNIGDEGGFAPKIGSTKEALDLLMQAIEKVRFKPGYDMALALDVAANEFSNGDGYLLRGENKHLSSDGMIEFYEDLLKNYPIISIEDPLAEDDWEGWQRLTQKIGDRVQLVGDDLFVTNLDRIEKGLKMGAANAVLIKPNQIGTLTETIHTQEFSQRFGLSTIISHRSGETEDTTIADIAVATQAGQIKTGSMCRTDRMAKYNQLLRIEEELSHHTRYLGHQAFLRTTFSK